MVSQYFYLKQFGKPLYSHHNEKRYIIGYKNIINARKVQYDMNFAQPTTILRDELEIPVNIENKMVLDVKATLFIPKSKQPLNGLLDGGITLDNYKDNEFFRLPILDKIGVIIAYNLEHEDDDEFVYRAFILDPFN